MDNEVKIIFSANDEASKTVSTLTNNITGMDDAVKTSSFSMTELNSALSVAKEAFDQVQQAVDATVGVLVDYASEVRGLQQITGASAEETSRLIQVADDYKVSVEDLTMAQKMLAKDGITLTTNSLAKLSDEYLKLNPGQERSAFLMEKFGRAGFKMAELMQQGGKAIRESSAAVDDSLVLTQEAVDLSRKYEAQLDDLADRFDALKITIGQELLPVLSNLIGQYQELADESGALMGVLQFGWDDIFEAVTNTASAYDETSTAIQNTTDSGEDLTETLDEQQAAIEAVTEANKELLSVVGDINSAYEGYAEAQQGIDEKRLELQKQLQEAMQAQGEAQSDKDWAAEGEKIEEIRAKLVGLRDDELALAQQRLDDHNMHILQLVEQKLAVDGLSDAETEFLVQKQQEAGLISQADVDAAKAAIAQANALVEEQKAAAKKDGQILDEKGANFTDYASTIETGANKSIEYINKYIDALESIPSDINTNLTQTGTNNAQNEMSNMQNSTAGGVTYYIQNAVFEVASMDGVL